MKKILWIVGILILLLISVVLTLPVWDSTVLRPVVNSVVPRVLSTKFKMDALHINQYLGRVILDGLRLENPEGYSERVACSIEHFTIDVDMSTAMSDVIVVETIELKNVFVSYVKDDKGLNNFDRLLASANGGYDLRDDEQRVAYEERQAKELELKLEKAKTAEVAEKAKTNQSADAQPAKPEAKKPSKKFIIDRLEVRGVLVQWGKLTMPMPPIVLTELGRKEGGLSPDEIQAVIFATFMRSLSAIGVSLKDIGVDLGNVAGALSESGVENLNKGIEAIKKLDTKGATDALKGATDSLKGAGDALKGATDSLKSLFN